MTPWMKSNATFVCFVKIINYLVSFNYITFLLLKNYSILYYLGSSSPFNAPVVPCFLGGQSMENPTLMTQSFNPMLSTSATKGNTLMQKTQNVQGAEKLSINIELYTYLFSI